MSTSASTDSARRELRQLRLYALASTLAILVLFIIEFRLPDRLEIESLDVARINVLNESGYPALVIAARGKLPGPWFEGREYSQELSGGRVRASGMIFFNERGDEVGGLTYHGHLTEDGYSAGGGVTFDQFQQDQVVSLQYQDDGARRAAGLQVWDRSTEISLQQILDLVEGRRTATGPERDSIEAEIRALAEVGVGVHRVFLGSEDRSAVLLLKDRAGRARVRLYVDSLDTGRLEFLDADGQVVQAFPN